MQRMQVAAAVDDRYAYPLIITAASLQEAARESLLDPQASYSWLVAHDPLLLSERTRTIVTDAVQALGAHVEYEELDLAARFRNNGHISATAFARLPLADRLDDFLWLDVDLLCRSGAAELLDANSFRSTGAIVQARAKGVEMRWRERAPHNAAFAAAQDRYFNSGVMRISGARWRANGLDAAWPLIVERYDELGFEWSDQCVLNYMLAGEYADLADRFNCGPDELLSSGQEPAVVHFTGAGKPWKSPQRGTFLRQQPRRRFTLEYWATERRALAVLESADAGLAAVVRGMREALVDSRPIDHSRTVQRVHRLASAIDRRVRRVHGAMPHARRLGTVKGDAKEIQE